MGGMGPACGPPEPVNPPRRSRHGRRREPCVMARRGFQRGRSRRCRRPGRPMAADGSQREPGIRADFVSGAGLSVAVPGGRRTDGPMHTDARILILGPNDRLRTFNPDFGSCIHRNDRFETAVAVGIYGPGSPVVRWDAYIDPSAGRGAGTGPAGRSTTADGIVTAGTVLGGRRRVSAGLRSWGARSATAGIALARTPQGPLRRAEDVRSGAFAAAIGGVRGRLQDGLVRIVSKRERPGRGRSASARAGRNPVLMGSRVQSHMKIFARSI